jgi:hypothetical protein
MTPPYPRWWPRLCRWWVRRDPFTRFLAEYCDEMERRDA